MTPKRRFRWLSAWPLLMFFVFTIPWEKSVWIPWVGSIARFIGLAAFAAGAIEATRRRELRRPNGALLAAVAFVAWSCLTWLWSLDREATAMRAMTFVQLAAMVWLIYDQCRGPARQIQLLAAYVCGALFGSGLAFDRYLRDEQTYYLRYAAGGFTPNDFGIVLALAIPLAMYLALRSRGFVRWWWLVSIPVLIEAVLLTASRAALIATFAAFLFALWTWWRADWMYRIVTALFLCGLALSVVQFAPEPQRKRLATIGAEITTGTLHNRTHIWKAGLKALKEHPVFGVGSGAYPKAVAPWLGKSTVKGFQYVAHNTFLSVLVECGFIGFVLCTLLMAVLAFYVWSLAPPERALWTVMAVVWAVGVSTLTWEHYKPTWLIMALIMTERARAVWTDWHA